MDTYVALVFWNVQKHVQKQVHGKSTISNVFGGFLDFSGRVIREI